MQQQPQQQQMQYQQQHQYQQTPIPFTNQLAYQQQFVPPGWTFDSPFVPTSSARPQGAMMGVGSGDGTGIQSVAADNGGNLGTGMGVGVGVNVDMATSQIAYPTMLYQSGQSGISVNKANGVNGNGNSVSDASASQWTPVVLLAGTKDFGKDL